MRCLNCHTDELKHWDKVCSKCGVEVESMLRDCLRRGTQLGLGRYLIDFPLGKGGFGITYRAIHKELERPFAIKEFYPKDLVMMRTSEGKPVLRAGQEDKYQRARDKFYKEAQSLALIDHPNVSFANDVFMEPSLGTVYLVMNLVTGRTLRQELEAAPNRRLPEERVRKIMSELVSALTAAHRQNISHLDIKPDNVMINEVDGRTVLVDFGAARVDLGVETVDPTTQAFTFAYAAPEVILRGKDKNKDKPGPYSDIFELGMLLHELLTGAPPQSAMDRIYPSRIEELDCRELGEPWAQMVTAATCFTIANRPQSVADWWNYEAQMRERSAQQLRDVELQRHRQEIERIEINRRQAESEKQHLVSILEQREQLHLGAQQELSLERGGLLAEIEQLADSLSLAEQETEDARQELAHLENSVPALLTALASLLILRLKAGLGQTSKGVEKIRRSYRAMKAEQLQPPYDSVTLPIGQNGLVVRKAALFPVFEIGLGGVVFLALPALLTLSPLLLLAWIGLFAAGVAAAYLIFFY